MRVSEDWLNLQNEKAALTVPVLSKCASTMNSSPGNHVFVLVIPCPDLPRTGNKYTLFHCLAIVLQFVSIFVFSIEVARPAHAHPDAWTNADSKAAVEPQNKDACPEDNFPPRRQELENMKNNCL